MIDVDKRNPDWQISQLLTRHAAGLLVSECCAIVLDLRDSISSRTGLSPKERLERAQKVECTCGHDTNHKAQEAEATERYLKHLDVHPEDEGEVSVEDFVGGEDVAAD